MNITIITQPEAEPVTLNEAKQWLRLDEIGDDDNLILGLIMAAREKCEADTGVVLMSRTVDESFDTWPKTYTIPQYYAREIELGLWPVSSVSSVKYIDENGSEQTLSPSLYTVDLTQRPARVVLNPDEVWPDIGGYPSAVKVRYVAGYSSITDIPSTLKVAMKWEITKAYDNREDGPVTGRMMSERITIHQRKIFI